MYFLGFLLDLFVLFWGDELLMGVKDSFILGKGREALGEDIEVERFFLLERILLFMEYGLH